MNGLHLFIDNSNLYIEAQRVARQEFRYDDELVLRLRISYGALLDEVRNERKLMETILVGSRPPENDSLWNKLASVGIEPRISDRSYWSRREKDVDAELSNAIRDALEDNPEPGTIALVAGDADYVPTLLRCVKKKWAVEVYFWGQAAAELRALEGATFISLNAAFERITFRAKSKD